MVNRQWSIVNKKRLSPNGLFNPIGREAPLISLHAVPPKFASSYAKFCPSANSASFDFAQDAFAWIGMFTVKIGTLNALTG